SRDAIVPATRRKTTFGIEWRRERRAINGIGLGRRRRKRCTAGKGRGNGNGASDAARGQGASRLTVSFKTTLSGFASSWAFHTARALSRSPFAHSTSP